MSPDVSVIIPLFNEEKIFPRLILRLDEIIKSSDFTIEIILIDDGSTDLTPELMRKQALDNQSYQCLFLSKNHGHQIAVTAGMYYAKATRAVMIMDGDLQDPPEMITKFFEKILDGYDVVYAIRKKRKEGLIKKAAYWAFYRFQKKILKFNIPVDAGDFSMISRRIVNIINDMPEKSRFIRGIRAWVGFNQTGIEYDRAARSEGETKYSFKMLRKLAYDGIYNFTNVPLKVITRLGLYTLIFSFLYIIYILGAKYFYGDVPQGFTTLFIAIAIFSGVQLICLGIIGEYVARTYTQVQQRPIFILKERILDKKSIYE